MNTDNNLDRESFQKLLASAFAVQESQIDSQLLSGIMEVQRLITKGELGVEGAMHLIVDSARDVANAAGAAIGLLEGNQLIYRAASGCSATYIGSRVKASLTVSADTRSSREILRVENAETDTRIEAAICRQFGAKSLLILPIYHDQVLAGVLEILFSEEHIFQDGEVRTYRLMAGLIEAAMEQAQAEQKEKENLAADLVFPHAMEELTPQSKGFLNDYYAMSSSRMDTICEQCGAALAALRDSPVLRQSALLAKVLVQRGQEVTWNKRRRNLALAAAAAGFGLTFWIAYGRGPASPSGSSALPGSNAVEQREHFESAKAVPLEGTPRSSKDQTLSASRKQMRSARAMARRVRVGQNEVEYIGDDVTVRHFTYKPATLHRAVNASRVAHIGDDVTVRYFTPRPAVKPDSQ